MFNVILTVIAIMGPGKDDVTQSRPMASLDECWSAAQSWDAQDAKAAGVAGFASGCSISPTPGRDG